MYLSLFSLPSIAIGSPRSGLETKEYYGCVSYYVANNNFDYYGSVCDNPVNGTANMGSTLTILDNDDFLVSGIYGKISGSNQGKVGSDLALGIAIQGVVHKLH